MILYYWLQAILLHVVVKRIDPLHRLMRALSLSLSVFVRIICETTASGGERSGHVSVEVKGGGIGQSAQRFSYQVTSNPEKGIKRFSKNECNARNGVNIYKVEELWLLSFHNAEYMWFKGNSTFLPKRTKNCS